MRMKHCRPRCAGTTIHGDQCRMTAALVDGKLSRFCKFHDERTRAQGLFSAAEFSTVLKSVYCALYAVTGSTVLKTVRFHSRQKFRNRVGDNSV
jgi:hypothetical protein